MSLTERQQKIAQLKERTACRRCGQVGHWSSDPSCPKGKGGKSKGKTTSSSSSSTPNKGKGKSKESANRCVYFAVKGNDEDWFPPEDEEDDSMCYMAMRFNAVPPPSSLEDGSTASPTISSAWSIVEAEERLRTASNEMVLNQDDLDMVMLREALGGEVPQEPDPLRLEDQKTTPPPGLSNIFRGITSFFGHQPAYPLPGDLQDLPRMDMDLEAEMSSHFAIEDRFPEHFKDAAPPDPGQQRRDERGALSMLSSNGQG